MQVTHNGAAVLGSESGSATIPASTYQGQTLVTAAAGDTVGLQIAGLATPVNGVYGSMLVEQVAG